jgi:hypothetical protein
MRARRWGRYGGWISPSERFRWEVEFVVQTAGVRMNGSIDYYDDYPFHRSDMPHSKTIETWLRDNIPADTYIVLNDAVLFEQEEDAILCFTAFAK